MTCIAAVVGDDGHVYMGGDSAGVSDDSVLSLGVGAESKIWESNGILFGCCGSFRVAQVIRWQIDFPHYNPKDDPLGYLTGSFITTLRDSLREHGSLTVWEEDSTENMGGGVLLGFCGRVFEIFSDFGVGELIHNYGSVGCGSPIAMGSLATTEALKTNPKKRIQIALEAAERHSAGVRGPMKIIKS